MTQDLARAIVAHLDAVLPKHYRSFAIPICAHLPPIPGLRAGAPRLAIVGGGQETWLVWCAAHGTPYCAARSVEDVRTALEYWRIPERAAA